MSKPGSIIYLNDITDAPDAEMIQPTVALKFVGGVLHQQFEILTYGMVEGLKSRRVEWRPVPSEPGPINEDQQT
ncbi:hypothetical protein [Mesorhizobium sp. A556]